jgi:hypothetical protein
MENRSFNEGLGEKLRAASRAPETTGKTTRIAAAIVIALIAAGVPFVTGLWMGH